MTTTTITNHDLLPHLIGLQFAIREMVSELAVDTITEHPRLVLMALRGLEARAAELVAMAVKTEEQTT